MTSFLREALRDYTPVGRADAGRMPGMRRAIAAIAACLLATPALAAPSRLAGPAYAWIVDPGESLVAPGALPLFPSLVGRPAARWLEAFDGEAMTSAWGGGYHQRHPLGPGLEAAVVRARGVLAAYLLRKDAAGEACIGQVVHEPRRLKAADAADRGLRRAGFAVRRGFLSTPGATFAADAGFFERRAGGFVERYVFVRLPATGAGGAPVHLAEAAFYPAAHEAAISAWTHEGREAVAAVLAARAADPTSESR